MPCVERPHFNKAIITMSLFLRIALLKTAVIGINFHPIEWEKYEHIADRPVHLVEKVFTDDGFDPAKAILAEGERDASEMEAKRVAMDKEFERIRDLATSGPKINIKNIAQYAPRVTKLDVSI